MKYKYQNSSIKKYFANYIIVSTFITYTTKTKQQMDIESTLNDLLNKGKENEVIEFKSAKSTFDYTKLGKYFSALSNEANIKGVTYAWLILGVTDDKNICGTQFQNGNNDLDNLKAKMSQDINSFITFEEIHELNIQGKRVLMFQIPPAPKGIPTTFKGHYYGRNGESLVPLNIAEIEAIRAQSSAEDWSAKTIPSATIKDLDQAAISFARENYIKKNKALEKEVTQWDDITFLNKAKITIKGQITNTAIILLGKAESDYLIQPQVAKITWVLRDKSGIEKDYEHFGCPFILAVNSVYNKIRNLKYRYIQDANLFPEEVDQYAPQSIREALNNCIAHQDYSLCHKISVTEREDGSLTFVNAGSFLPGSINEVINNDSPPSHYRNNFLTQAMVNLNMIDTIGSGIKRMFRIQSEKFFPMPEYDLSNNRVSATLIGKVLNPDFARALASHPSLTLHEIILLDKLQKNKSLTKEETIQLKQKKLIEGRKPNYYISSTIAKKADQKAAYIKNRGVSDKHYKNMILELLGKYKECTREDIDNLLLDILPKVLTPEQKMNKIRNIIYAMSKKDKTISNAGTTRIPIWKKTS